ncbi:MAG: hypothetical protein ACKVQQ_23205 [Burkholderiales bacterium]
MPDMFQRLPGFKETPAGLERMILKRLPRVLVGGTLLMFLPSLLVRLGGAASVDAALPFAATSVDIFVIALVFLHWNLVLILAIGAFIVMVMKGPAFVADAYTLEEADQPVPNTPPEKRRALVPPVPFANHP